MSFHPESVPVKRQVTRMRDRLLLIYESFVRGRRTGSVTS
jgi:regulator of extracellular matrix RemA (YlzA/DUF370 family)